MIDCPACEGTGCTDCGDKGYFELTHCPALELTRDVWELIEMADLFRKGIPPVAGGSLDQAKQFVSAARLVWREQERYEAERNPFKAFM